MNSNDLLEDFSSQRFKSKFHATILILLAAYLGYFLFDFFFDRQTFELKTGSRDWSVFAFLFVLPLAGTLFFAFHKKAGWFICNSYFWFLTFTIITSLVKNAIEKTIYFNWHSVFVTAAVLCVSILLLAKQTRQHFRIGKRMFITSLSLAVIISSIFIYIVLSF